MIRGVGASDGVAIGKAFVKEEAELKIVLKEIADQELELERFNTAAEKCRIDLERRYNKTMNILGDEEAEVYNRHLGVFNGSILLGQVRKEIQEQNVNAEHILNEVKKKYASMFDRVADDFLKKKSESIKYIAEQIIKELLEANQENLSEIEEPVILIAAEIDSNDVIQLDKNKVLAIVTESGGKSSYSAIIASNFEVPAIVGATDILSAVKNGDEVIVDGNKGEIIVNPTQADKEGYFRKVNHEKEMLDVYKNYVHKETVTKDGHKFELSVASDNLNEIKEAREAGTESIGVMSTEFCFVGRDQAPDEESQFIAYRDAVTKAEGLPVVFRTLDCLADNSVPYLYFQHDRNPLMGLRGIRVTLAERELFVNQLRAILKASAYGPAKILFPMITSIEELLDAKMAVEEAKLALQETNEFYDPDIQIGMIIETPSAAMMTDLFAPEVDFFMIGTTNLLQFMNGVDRTNESLRSLYDSCHPGPLRMISRIITAAHKEGTRVGLTGDMTKPEYMMPVYVAMGVDLLCIDMEQITKTRWSVGQMEKVRWDGYLDEILMKSSASEIRAFVEGKYFEDMIGSVNA